MTVGGDVLDAPHPRGDIFNVELRLPTEVSFSKAFPSGEGGTACRDG